jgi:hypothetical protein
MSGSHLGEAGPVNRAPELLAALAQCFGDNNPPPSPHTHTHTHTHGTTTTINTMIYRHCHHRTTPTITTITTSNFTLNI